LGGREPSQPRLLDKEFSALTAGRRFNAGVMSAFGVVALIIAAMGVYSTMAFLVARQTRGIGVRLALGASKARIVRLILSTAARRLVVGGVVGLAAAWLVSGVFSALIFGFRTTDPWTYLVVAFVIGVAGLLAAYAPALRACRIDPIVALHQE
jgi:ABC-type antimicrobial peptide transport system permease subunit